jgi:dTDP-4-amino-4,6-dideoxygalactose transaminase
LTLIPFLNLKNLNSKFESELKSAFNTFLDSGYYILGENVVNFEKEYANYCDSKFCCGVANGLDALILILESYKFPPGSEIIVPANTYYASILSIIKAGLKPILIEPNLNDYLINVELIESKITHNTVAILAVNLYGKMCDFNSLKIIKEKYNINLIVDAAQSHGAVFENSKNCFGADAVAYSFYPSKNLGAFADAGAVVSDNEDLISKIKTLRNYGSEIKYQFEEKGINSRLSELQAAFLTIKLKYLDEEIDKRREIASKYIREIYNSKIVLPASENIKKDAWHLFVVRTNNRKKFTEYLKANGIGYDIHYPIPPHKQNALSEFSNLFLPTTEKIHQEIISLPLNSTLSSADVDYIIEKINHYK